MVIKMKNKKLKIIKTGLVAFLLLAGLCSVYVSASKNKILDSDDSIFSKPSDMIKFDLPSNGDSFLESAPLQNEYVDIKVVDRVGIPIYDAWIHVYKEDNPDFCWEGFTNEYGLAYWPKPNVDMDTTYKIKAEKYVNGDYLMSIVYVVIRNRYLNVYTSNNLIDEGSNFITTVTNQDNQLVSLAKVKFNGETKYTDSNGKTSFQAPWVDENTIFIIETSAPLRGYDNGYTDVTVCDCNSSSPHEVYGQVRDYDFNPVENVKIKIILEDYSTITYTNEAGDYSIWITPKEGGELVTITASHPDYPTQSVERWINSADAGSTHVNFWLVAEDGNGNQNSPQGQQGNAQQQQYGAYGNPGNYN